LFDLVKALELRNVPAKVKPVSQASTGRGLNRFLTSYSSKAVPTPTLDSSGPQNRSEGVKTPVTEFEYTQAMNQRIDKAMQERNEANANRLRGVERRLAIQNGEKVYTPYKPPRLTDEEEEQRRMLRSGAIQPQYENTFEYAQNTEWYKRSLAEWEFIKQERPWHAVKWPSLMTASGKLLSWCSMADPEYCSTETEFLEYAQVYLAQGIREHREILPVWIAKAKEHLGILEIKEKQAAVRTEILIEGRQEGLKSMQVLAKTRKKNCSGTELDTMAKPELKQPLGMFVLSSKQQEVAESRNLLQHPVPYVDGLEYVAINWLLFDTPRWIAYQELIRSPACAPRTYIDDTGTKRRLATGKVDKGTLQSVLERKEGE
jgi:hypothetical protein